MSKYDFGNSIMKIYRADKKMNESIENIKQKGKYEEYLKCISIMCTSKLFGNELKRKFRLMNVNELIDDSAFPILSLKKNFSVENFYKDLFFIEAYFNVNKKRVTEYMQLKNKFENEFLNGLKENADATLLLIQEKFGMSFWLIESKLLLYSQCDYKRYQDFYLRVRNSCENNLMKNHIRIIKRKANLRTRTKDYENFYLENIEPYVRCDEWEYKAYGHYARFMLFDNKQKLSDEIKKSLGVMLYHLSFVDAWLLYERLLICLKVSENNNDSNKAFDNYKKLFYSEDLERGNIYHIIKKDFCESKYESCINKCKCELEKNGNHFEILDLYIKCLVLTEKKFLIQPKDSPLCKLSDVLIKCYIKEDDSDYAYTYIDYCDQYNRALSMFSSYYELLGIVENTMEPWNEKLRWSFLVKMYNRNFISEELVCIQQEKNEYLQKLKLLWNELYTCEWNYRYRNEYNMNEFYQDKVSKQMTLIDQGDCSVSLKNEMSNFDIICYEEYMVYRFHKYVEEEKYIEAIHLYVDVYTKNTFHVLKMDIDKLESRLSNAIRRGMLEEIDYFIFLDIGRKRRAEKNIFDQAMVDSFGCILKKYNIRKPSEIIPLDECPTNSILMFWEGCCNRILNESPCDLYDEEELDEEILLLNRIIKYNPKTLYKEWLVKLELKRDYEEIIKLYGKMEWITDKIMADEILLENDENIMSSYDGLCGLSMHQILENEKKVSLFQDVFVRCKKEYVKQVNEQMGTRIRHSVLDTEFVQLLKKYQLFFPLCTEQEMNIIFQNNICFDGVETGEREFVFRKLQDCCIKLFENIGLAKKELLFFTHKEKFKEFTSMYISIEELKGYMQRVEDISNEARFISEIKNILDSILVDRLYILRECVKERLIEIKRTYVSSLSTIIEESNFYINVESLDKEMEELINKIVAWFKLFSNGERECDFNIYWEEQAQAYSDYDFKLIYTGGGSVKLKVIRDIDMILKNLIRNIQLHSGYAANLREAKAQFIAYLNNTGHFVLETSNRVISNKEKERLVNFIETIDKMSYEEEVSDNLGLVDGKGQGYQSIKSILDNNYSKTSIDINFRDDIFKAKIEFDLERK